MKSVLFAASECSPFVRTDDMADFVEQLPKAFNSEIWDIRVVIPGYSFIETAIKKKFHKAAELRLCCGGSLHDKSAAVYSCREDGITWYLIDNEEFFHRPVPYLGLEQDIPAFAFFSMAVAEMLPALSYKPEIIQCLDWQTGLLPVYLKTACNEREYFGNIKTILNVHHLQYQALCDIDWIRSITGFDTELFTSDRLEFHGQCNLLKAGLVYADYITTVSEVYGYEILTESHGRGLSGILSARHLQVQGILSGIDYDAYSFPVSLLDSGEERDFAVRKYKSSAKLQLQKELCLWENDNLFMIMVSLPLCYDQGLDLICGTLEMILDDYTQVILLGEGDRAYEEKLRSFAWRYSDQIYYCREYDDELWRRVMLASDAFLYTPRFCSCSSLPMIASHLGTLPIVYETGALREIVAPYNIYDNSGDGFSFRDYRSEDLAHVVNYAKQIYYDRSRDWQDMMYRAMYKDFSWKRTVKGYEQLYDSLINE